MIFCIVLRAVVKINSSASADSALHTADHITFENSPRKISYFGEELGEFAQRSVFYRVLEGEKLTVG